MNDRRSRPSGIAKKVQAFYEQHPYPPAVANLDRYRDRWQDPRMRRLESHLYWPGEPYRANRSILVAGCGTSQAAKHALRWPEAKVVGIDVSKTSIRETWKLKQKYGLENSGITPTAGRKCRRSRLPVRPRRVHRRSAPFA